MMKKIQVALVVVLFGLSTTTSAGVIIVSGDSTPAYYASNNDNNTFFLNVLQGGNTVQVHELSNSTIGRNLSTYYNGLSGVSSTHSIGSDITPTSLAGVDLLVTGLDSGALSVSELAALNGFVTSGGSVFFMGDYTRTTDAINAALSHLGSVMRLTEPIRDPGDHFATGSQIIADAMTAGVSSYHYGATYGVSGGKPLFLDTSGRCFTAVIPEPMSVAMIFMLYPIMLLRRHLCVGHKKGSAKLHILLNKFFSKLFLKATHQVLIQDKWID